MKIHHLNCGTICPRFPSFITGHPHLICHCLAIETERGLVLVDTGFGLEDVRDPVRRLGRMLPTLAKLKLDPEETAARQVERLGFKRADVRHIVLTHLDVDHAGGLADFPDAEIHVLESEYEAAMARKTRLESYRYHSVQWAHGPKWVRHSVAGESWNGFGAVRALDERMPEVLLVPLHGHTRGHCGVAVRSGDGWLLHAGDAYFHRAEMAEPPSCPFGMDVFQRIIQMAASARLGNQARLRELKKSRGNEVRVFSSHDPEEL